MPKLKEGFKGQRLITISPEILMSSQYNPLTKSLYLTKIGFFPAVKYHYNRKDEGVDYYILIYCTSGEGWYKIADKTYVFKSIDEPYTYNVSTYMGMILSATKENPVEILEFIKNIKLPDKFDDYKAYSFVLPDKYLNICPMLDIKKSELFGPNLSLRAFSQGHARHAKFVIRSKNELVISLSHKNEYFGDPESRWDLLSIPENFDFAAVMAITYYIVGKIQISKTQYYKENIKNYVNDYGPKAYGLDKPFDLIVPGTSK